jgi:hypothetical protein
MLQDADRTHSKFEPIKHLAESKRALDSASGTDYATNWFLRTFFIELTKHTIEDRYVDVRSSKVKDAIGAMTELCNTREWAHPKLVRALTALKELSSLAPERFKFARKRVADVTVVERIAEGQDPFQISNRASRVVPIMEDSLGDPASCSSLIEAFAARVTTLKNELGVTHLLFIEKEIGPVGALPIMAALVAATNLPACVFRESFDQLQPSLDQPGANARVAIVYDMLVSGDGIKNVADRVREDVGASTVAAVVLRGYGSQISDLHTAAGQHIKLETLGWGTTEESTYPSFTSGVESEDLNDSGVAKPQEGATSTSTQAIPPGTYTKETFPEISEGAKRILARVRAAQPRPRPSDAAGPTGVRLRDSGPLLGIKFKDSGNQLGIKNIKP